MLLTGQVTVKQATQGQDIDIEIGFTYPSQNAATYEGIEQPLTPPIELQSLEFRFTDDDAALINPDNINIKWLHFLQGTGDEPTADLVDNVWVGRTGVFKAYGLPVKAVWYYQARSWGRNGVASDWTSLGQVVDNPEPLPVPQFVYGKTNANDQVLLAWTDVAIDIVNFSHYELVAQELDVSRRLDTDAVIVGSD